MLLKSLLPGPALWFCLHSFTFLCVQIWGGGCSFPRNWLQSLGWDSESGRFLEKSREAWHPQNRNNNVPFVGTPMWDCSWSRGSSHNQAAHYALLAPDLLPLKRNDSLGATFSIPVYSKVMRAPCLERRACDSFFIFFLFFNPSYALREEGRAGSLTPDLLPSSSQGLALRFSHRTLDAWPRGRAL